MAEGAQLGLSQLKVSVLVPSDLVISLGRKLNIDQSMMNINAKDFTDCHMCGAISFH